jgi:hypothetical protein
MPLSIQRPTKIGKSESESEPHPKCVDGVGSDLWNFDGTTGTLLDPLVPSFEA